MRNACYHIALFFVILVVITVKFWNTIKLEISWNTLSLLFFLNNNDNYVFLKKHIIIIIIVICSVQWEWLRFVGYNWKQL
jgi:hypothetical protein